MVIWDWWTRKESNLQPVGVGLVGVAICHVAHRVFAPNFQRMVIRSYDIALKPGEQCPGSRSRFVSEGEAQCELHHARIARERGDAGDPAAGDVAVGLTE